MFGPLTTALPSYFSTKLSYKWLLKVAKFNFFSVIGTVNSIIEMIHTQYIYIAKRYFYRLTIDYLSQCIVSEPHLISWLIEALVGLSK